MRGYKVDRLAGENPIVEKSDAIPEWMTGFVSKAKEIVQRTAVQQARERSIHEQMTSINGAKFSSTEEAIKSYQERTGLTDYLKMVSAKENLQKAAIKIMAAGIEEEKK